MPTAKRVDSSKSKILEKESKYFDKHKDDLVEMYEGQYVLIKGSKLIGSFTTKLDAYKAGIESFGNQPFLIKLVTVDEDETAYMPAFTLGLIDARS